MDSSYYYIVKKYPEKEGVILAETFLGPFNREEDAIRFMKLSGFFPPEFHIEKRIGDEDEFNNGM